jgi:hypothetical protein
MYKRVVILICLILISMLLFAYFWFSSQLIGQAKGTCLMCFISGFKNGAYVTKQVKCIKSEFPPCPIIIFTEVNTEIPIEITAIPSATPFVTSTIWYVTWTPYP